MPGLSGTLPPMTTSVRECRLRKTELSKLYHLKRELENEILCQSRQERRSDSPNELQNKHLRVLLLQIHGVPAAVRASSSSFDSSSSPTATATSMQVDESNQDSSKRQTVTHGADMELEGLVMESERDRLQRYSDSDFLVQVKQNADVYLDRNVSNDHRERNCEERIDTVRCASISPCGGNVFKSKACTSCPQIWSRTGISV